MTARNDSYEAVHKAIRNRFLTQWGSKTEIAWPNSFFGPNLGSGAVNPWVKLEILDSAADEVAFGGDGNNRVRYQGIATVMVFVPLDSGDNKSLEYADEVTRVFRKFSHPDTGLFFDRPPFIRTIGVTGRWFQVNVLCPFRRDSIQ